MPIQNDHSKSTMPKRKDSGPMIYIGHEMPDWSKLKQQQKEQDKQQKGLKKKFKVPGNLMKNVFIGGPHGHNGGGRGQGPNQMGQMNGGQFAGGPNGLGQPDGGFGVGAGGGQGGFGQPGGFGAFGGSVGGGAQGFGQPSGGFGGGTGGGFGPARRRFRPNWGRYNGRVESRI
jgi:hypothetical protein